MRTLVALLAGITSGGLARAEPDDTHVTAAEAQRASTDDTRISLHASTGIGIGIGPFLGGGAQLARGASSLAIDADLAILPPVCLFDVCVGGAAPGASLAYHYQIVDRWFVGPRIGARYEWVIDNQPMNAGRGWLASGVLEAGHEWKGVRADLGATLGAGVETTLAGARDPIVLVRLTFTPHW